MSKDGSWKNSQFIISVHALFWPMRFRKEISCAALRSCGIFRKIQHYLKLFTPFTVPDSLNLFESLTHLNNCIVFSPQCHQEDEVIAFWRTVGSFRIKSYVCPTCQGTSNRPCLKDSTSAAFVLCGLCAIVPAKLILSSAARDS